MWFFTLCLFVIVLVVFWKPIMIFQWKRLLRKRLGDVISQDEAKQLFEKYEKIIGRQKLEPDFWKFDSYQIIRGGIAPVCSHCGQTIILSMTYKKHLVGTCVSRQCFEWSVNE